jgi:hypothetical protein
MKKKRTGNEESQLSESRQQYFDDSKFDASNQKYGLFSYTGTLAISNKPYFVKTASHKNKEGLVETKPRNFIVGPSKRGKTADTYFSLPEYKSDNEVKNSRKAKPKPDKVEVVWRPGGALQEKYNSYEHLPADNVKKISRRGPDGLVVIEPKNLYTSPARLGTAMSTPGLLIGGHEYEYEPDAYDRQHRMQQEELKRNKAKMQADAFKPPNPTGKNFFDNQKTYGETNMPKKTMQKVMSLNIYKHDRVFYPANPSKLGATIGKFPEYIEDPLSSPKRRPPSEQVPWRPTTNERTRPSPSVTNLAKNLRAEYPILRKNH